MFYSEKKTFFRILCKRSWSSLFLELFKAVTLRKFNWQIGIWTVLRLALPWATVPRRILPDGYFPLRHFSNTTFRQNYLSSKQALNRYIFKRSVNNKKYLIYDALTWRSSFLIYLIECTKCIVQYIDWKGQPHAICSAHCTSSSLRLLVL